MKIAIYGSAFNPPHLGHMDAIDQIINKFDLILLIPSYSHAFAKKMAPFEKRCEMLKIILSEVYTNNEKLEISEIEKEIYTGSPIFSYDLLCSLRDFKYPNDSLYLVIGPDNADPITWSKFYKHDDITKEFNLEIVQQRKEIRSTLIRNAIKASDRRLSLKDMVGEGLAEYLVGVDLY